MGLFDELKLEPTPGQTGTASVLTKNQVLDEFMRRDHELCGNVSSREANEILVRFCNSHFNNPGQKARMSIPANPREDDDLRMGAFIARAEMAFRLLARMRRLESLRNIVPIADLIELPAIDRELVALGIELPPPQLPCTCGLRDLPGGWAAACPNPEHR